MVERTSLKSLHMWRVVLLEGVRTDEPDLSMRQLSILLSVYLTDPPHTVRGLAAELAIGKPAVTRALDTLERLGLLKRQRDRRDRRSVNIQRSVRGAVYLSEFSDRIVTAEHQIEEGKDQP